MNNISVIGIGKLGLCLALNLANSGFKVLGVDINQNYVNDLNEKKFISSEPYVNYLLSNNNNFEATTNLEQALIHSDILFIMVATPSLENGKYDHKQIENVLTQIEILGQSQNKKMLIIGCTTFPGYCESIFDRMSKLNYEIAYNPEFIAQGNIIYGQLYPDLVLIGSKSDDTGNKIAQIYQKMCKNKPKYELISLTEAELTKLAINCFITTKISYANMIGDLCNLLGISHESVLEAIGNDSRIGSKYLKWGFGFGGPCFPRDNRALAILCSENNIQPEIPIASDNYNNLHSIYQTQHVLKNEVNNSSYKIFGVSYKKGSNSIEESQQLKLALNLVDSGINVTICDSKEIIEKVKKIYQDKFKYEDF